MIKFKGTDSLCFYASVCCDLSPSVSKRCAISVSALCMFLGSRQTTRRDANNFALPSGQSSRKVHSAKQLLRPIRHADMSLISRDQLVQAIQTSPEQTIRDLHKHQGEDIRLNSPNVQVTICPVVYRVKSISWALPS